MEIERKLEKLRKGYIQIKPPNSLVEYGFSNLRKTMFEKHRPLLDFSIVFERQVHMIAVFFVVAVIFLFGTVKVAQGALPGDFLYSVKRLSEDVIVAISGDSQFKAERRAQEIVGLIKRKKDLNLIEKALGEYKNEVLKTKNEINKSKRREKELEEKLEKHDQEIEGAIESEPSIKKDFKKIFDEVKRDKDMEVKGVRDNDERDKKDADNNEDKEKDDENVEKEDSRSGSNSGHD